MTIIIKPKSLLSVILSAITLLISISLSAASPSLEPSPEPPLPTEHRQVINQFISEINQIQNQVLDLSQLALNNPPLFEERLKSNIGYINHSIERLNSTILEYLQIVPKTGPQNVHVLLVLNSLNFVKNGLYWLEALTYVRENVQRISLLNEYFRSRIAAIDTLNTLTNILLQYNQ